VALTGTSTRTAAAPRAAGGAVRAGDGPRTGRGACPRPGQAHGVTVSSPFMIAQWPGNEQKNM